LKGRDDRASIAPPLVAIASCGGRLNIPARCADCAGTMARRQITEAAPAHVSDEQLVLVAEVAAREGWSDLRRPVVEAFPRTLSEQEAVYRYAGALPRARAGATARTLRRARVAMLVLLAVGLLACWLVSPERTALGLVVVGVFSLIGLRRRRRRATRAPVPGRRGGALAGALGLR
jgi:Flp pilus assembly protein TadB